MIRPPVPIFPTGTPVAVVTDLGGPRAAGPGFSAPEQMMGLSPPARPPHHHPFFASGSAAPPAHRGAGATGAPPIPPVYTREVVNYLLNAARGADGIPEAQLWQRRRAALPLVTAMLFAKKFQRKELVELDQLLWALVADPKSRDERNAMHFDLLMAYMTLTAQSSRYDKEFAEHLVSQLGERHETVSEPRSGAYPFSKLVWIHAHMGIDPEGGAPESEAEKSALFKLGEEEKLIARSKEPRERYSFLRYLRPRLANRATEFQLGSFLSSIRAIAILLADGHPQIRDEAMKAYVDLRERFDMAGIYPILSYLRGDIVTRPLAERVSFASGASGRGVNMGEITNATRIASRNFTHPEKSEDASLPRAGTLAGLSAISAADVMAHAKREGLRVRTTTAISVPPAVAPQTAAHPRAALAEEPDEFGDPRLGRTR